MLCFSPEYRRHLKEKLEKGYMLTNLFPLKKAYIIYAAEESKKLLNLLERRH